MFKRAWVPIMVAAILGIQAAAISGPMSAFSPDNAIDHNWSAMALVGGAVYATIGFLCGLVIAVYLPTADRTTMAAFAAPIVVSVACFMLYHTAYDYRKGPRAPRSDAIVCWHVASGFLGAQVFGVPIGSILGLAVWHARQIDRRQERRSLTRS